MKRTKVFGKYLYKLKKNSSKLEKGAILESFSIKSNTSISNSSILSTNNNSLFSLTKDLSQISINSAKLDDQSYEINIPYKYQEKVFEMIKDQDNSIIFMETGKGKTLISIMLIGHLLNFDVFKQSKIKPESKHKKIVFLVCEVALVEQQKLVISRNTSLNVEALSGKKMKKFKGDVKKFRNFWDNCDVFVSTHQIIYNLLSCGYIKIFDIDLLIFDECHHMDGNHPYNIIMNEFYFFYKFNEEYSQNSGFKLPKILGLTASPLKKKIDGNNIVSTASKALSQLCENMDSVMVIDPDVLNYKETFGKDGILNLSVDEVKREFIEVDGHKTNKNFEAFMEIIHDSLLTPMINYIFEKETDEIKTLKDDYVKFVCEKFGSDDFTEYNKILSQYKYLYELRKQSWLFSVFEKIQINLYMILTNLNSRAVIVFLDKYRKYFEDLKSQFKDYSKISNPLAVELHRYRKYPDFTSENIAEFNTTIKCCLHQLRNFEIFETNRLEKLLDKIGDLFASNKANESYSPDTSSASDHRLIIFVENRIVSDILSEIINNYLDMTINCNRDTLNNPTQIKSLSVVGVAKKQCDNSFYPKNSAVQINQKIKKFTEGVVQIMVCTSTVEEGIDVKECDAVIVFTELKTTKSYIQMKGRARKLGSKFCIFSPNSIKTMGLIKNHVELIITMRKLFNEGIVKDFRDELNQEQKNEDFYKHFVPRTHAKLTLKNVAQLFNELFQILNERYKKTIKKKVIFYEEKGLSIKFKAVMKLECDWLRENEKTIESKLFNDKASAENFCFLIFLMRLHEKKIIDDNFQIS